MVLMWDKSQLPQVYLKFLKLVKNKNVLTKNMYWHIEQDKKECLSLSRIINLVSLGRKLNFENSNCIFQSK